MTTLNAPSTRVLSIDIFRGLTMAVMIFVNSLSDVHGLPWWTYHAHEQEDVMTYVDMVFPFFLFIVGMSMPLSIAQRLKRNASMPALWLHVILRSIGLVVLGLILANADNCDPAQMGMSGSTWGLLALIFAALYLNAYPKSLRFPNYARVLRAIGLIGVIVLLALFKRLTPTGQPSWIDFSYPEILGLIGISYLAVAILYIPTRRWSWAQPIWFVSQVLLCIYATAIHSAFPNHLPMYIWPFSNGAMTCIILAGVITSSLFLGKSDAPSQRRTISLALGFALVSLVAGLLLTPLGISKIRATPTWSLYCIGAAILLFSLLYWICDMRHWSRWAFFVRSAGENTLTTYLLPDLWFYISLTLGIKFLDNHFTTGWPGVVKTLLFTGIILVLARIVTRLKIRLQF